MVAEYEGSRAPHGGADELVLLSIAMNKRAYLIALALALIGMIAAWRILANRHVEQEMAWNHEQASIPVYLDDAIWGSGVAPVTVVMFNNLECGDCVSLLPALHELQSRYGAAKLRIVAKHFMEDFRKKARSAATAAEAVRVLGGNEAFWTFHDLAMQNQQRLGPESYRGWAADSGVDATAFDRAIAADDLSAKIDRDTALAKELNVRLAWAGTGSARIKRLSHDTLPHALPPGSPLSLQRSAGWHS